MARFVRILFVLAACAAAAPLARGYSLSGTSWGAGAVVTYSFDVFVDGYAIDETAYGGGSTTSVKLSDLFETGWENEIDAAFSTWASVANISFTRKGDNHRDFDDADAKEDIRFAAHIIDGPGGVIADQYPPPPFGVSAAGDIHFDSEESWHVGPGEPGPGELDLYSVALYEIGHAIGLDHSAISVAVMSPDYWYNESRLVHWDDVAGAQALYGSNSGPTPEPSAWLLAGAAVLAAASVARRKPERAQGAPRD